MVLRCCYVTPRTVWGIEGHAHLHWVDSYIQEDRSFNDSPVFKIGIPFMKLCCRDYVWLWRLEGSVVDDVHDVRVQDNKHSTKRVISLFDVALFSPEQKPILVGYNPYI